MSKNKRVIAGSVQNGNNRDSVVKDVVELLNRLIPVSQIVSKGDTVVVKPNLTGDSFLWGKGIVTNPYTVEGVVRYLQQATPGKIIIGESAAVGLNTKKAFETNVYCEVADRTGAILQDLNDDEFVDVPVKGGLVTDSIKISKTVVEADVLVNVPVMKTHVATEISLGMKNLKGIIPASEKKRSHYLGVNEFVVDINSVIKPKLTVIDGTIAMEGDGPMGGTPVNLGVILAGTDTISTDIAGAIVMGFKPEEIKTFKLASEKDAKFDWSNYRKLDNSTINLENKSFKRAEDVLPQYPNISVNDSGACSGCAQGLRVAMDRIKKMGLIEKVPPVTIALGKNALVSPEDNTIIIGRCLKEYSDKKCYISGCPPQVFLITDELRELAGEERLFGCKDKYLFKED